MRERERDFGWGLSSHRGGTGDFEEGEGAKQARKRVVGLILGLYW